MNRFRTKLVGSLLRCVHTSTALRDIKIKMPSLSPTMSAGTIVKWSVAEGDQVQPGDVLCEIQTDKAVMSLECDEEGTLAKIVIPENTADVPVGSLIAMLAEEGEDWKTIQVPSDSAASKPLKAATKEDAAGAVPSAGHSHTGIIGPAVRLLLDLYDIGVGKVPATGPHGVLLKGDVLSYITQNDLKPKPKTVPPPSTKAAPVQAKGKADEASLPQTSYTPQILEGSVDLPLSNMRKTIAKRLTESKSGIPHAYQTIDMNMEAVLQLRKELKKDGVSVSVNDFVVKSAAVALRAVPEVNVQLEGENSVRFMNSCDISVAVATEAGLITPIVANADQLGLQQISDTIRELAGRAKENKLKLHEFQGGSFTVSNLGMFGISEFTAIINPPQAAILAIGGSIQTLSSDLKAVNRMSVTLCFDNRAISEFAAARFLEAFSANMECPENMLMGGVMQEDRSLEGLL